MVEDVGELLSKAGLEGFSDNFKEQGFTTSDSLMILTMQDYSKFGVVQTEDKRKLFQIIQQQKQNKCKDGSKRMASVIDRLTSSERKSKEKRENSTIEPTPPNSTYFNRATFLRRSFNKTKNNENESAFQRANKKSMSSRTPSKKISNSASAESITHSIQSAKNHDLRKSASGRTDAYLRRNEVHTAPSSRHRANTTSVISSSDSRTRNSCGGGAGGGSSKMSDRIKVCVRKRPLNRREQTKNEDDVVDIPSTNQCNVYESKTSVDLSKFIQKHCYVFDKTFDDSADNETVYRDTAKPLVDWVFQGNKATCFAYGQTGSGKTFTMMGTKQIPGLVQLSAKDIFEAIRSEKYGNDFKVLVSFYEIYCGQLFDLINKRKRLNALENGKKNICIVGLQERQVYSHGDVTELLNRGGNRRSSGSTGVNSESSRSHAVLQVELKSTKDQPRGKFSFIDLAGSERAADVSDTNKQTRMEGAEINTSLLALKECIRALDQDSKHTPFRQSKLTQVLRDSFLGNSKTCMIASISPGVTSCEDTLNTLRYADRVKELGSSESSELDRPATAPSKSPTKQNTPDTESDGTLTRSSTGDTRDQRGDNVCASRDTRESTSDTRDSTRDNTRDTRDSTRDTRDSTRDTRDSTRVNRERTRDTIEPSDKRENQDNQVAREILEVGDALDASPTPNKTSFDESSFHDNFPIDTSSDLASDLPSDISLVSRTDSDISSPSPTKDLDDSIASLESHSTSVPPKDEVASEPVVRTKSVSTRSRKPGSATKIKKAQDDLTGSHEIHISQVANLCTLEAELLENYNDGLLDFGEYLKKLESILESKSKCVESLRAQVACYSLRAAY